MQSRNFSHATTADVSQADGTTGTFRQLDDIAESAIAKLAKSPKLPSTDNDPSMVFSEIDLQYFASLKCFQNSISRICDHKGMTSFVTAVALLTSRIEITPEIVVYRFSVPKLVEYLRAKVARIATPETFECCKTLIRGLAKQGLMEDGKEDLLQCENCHSCLCSQTPKDSMTVGRIRASCDLLSQYLPPDIREALIASYEYVSTGPAQLSGSLTDSVPQSEFSQLLSEKIGRGSCGSTSRGRYQTHQENHKDIGGKGWAETEGQGAARRREAEKSECEWYGKDIQLLQKAVDVYYLFERVDPDPRSRPRS